MGKLTIFSPTAIFPVGGKEEDEKVSEYSRVMNRGTNHVLQAKEKDGGLRVEFQKEIGEGKEAKLETIWGYSLQLDNISFWDFELYGSGGRVGYSKVRIYLKA